MLRLVLSAVSKNNSQFQASDSSRSCSKNLCEKRAGAGVRDHSLPQFLHVLFQVICDVIAEAWGKKF